ncbi:MAG: UDP-3-O-(3-hydroxymyristoyl)glucosamine N-acyltransferase [Bacteroidales bacterium]|nr:UDP-3-O-(3-hydroxymyristoyl)glucosamine N-acyltransferase [Bacteroidales bacterium]
MKFSAYQLAQLLNGEIVGDGSVEVSGVAKIEEGKPGCLSFLANLQYEKYIYQTQSSIVLVNKDFEPSKPIKATLIKVDNAYKSFAHLLEICSKELDKHPVGIEYPSFISSNVKVGRNVYIGAFSYISNNVVIGHNTKIYPNVFIGENVTIGDNTIIYSGVRIYKNCIVGNHCIIHSNTVIGSDGFGFASADHSNKKIPQIGNVVIEDFVEIGANCSIDRATMGSTIIRQQVKLDNLIQVAHNVEIGENTVIASQTGISGSTKIGKNCMIGGQVGIAGHLTIADEVKIAAQSGIGSSITKKGEIIQGSPAFNIKKYQKSYVHFKHLPEIINQLESLAKEVEELKKLTNK